MDITGSLKRLDAFIETSLDDSLKKDWDHVRKAAEKSLEKSRNLTGTPFVATGVTVQTPFPEEETTMGDLFHDLLDAAHERDILNAEIDKDVIDWAPDTVLRMSSVRAVLLRFTKDKMPHDKIKTAAKKLEAYDEYEFSIAVQLATQFIKLGQLDEANNTGIVIPLLLRKDNAVWAMRIWHNIHNSELKLSVYKIGPMTKYTAGSGLAVKGVFD